MQCGRNHKSDGPSFDFVTFMDARYCSLHKIESQQRVSPLKFDRQNRSVAFKYAIARREQIRLAQAVTRIRQRAAYLARMLALQRGNDHMQAGATEDCLAPS
ncbi:hypothetical protein D3C87_1450450 [compost metagenome]